MSWDGEQNVQARRSKTFSETKMIEEDDFDFGFTTEQDTTPALAESLNDYKSRMERMYKAVLPLLNNLEKNPDQEMIKWPNRDKKIKEFKLKLKNILEGKE